MKASLEIRRNGERDKWTPQLLRSRIQIWLAEVAGAALCRGIGCTTRYTDQNKTVEAARNVDGGPIIAALWHGTFFPWVYFWRGRGACVVTSRSHDGQMLAGVLRRMGFCTVRGSSTRGGARALIDGTRRIRSGADVVLALDGPNGPAHHAKSGAVLLSKLTGRPIVPLAAATNLYWRFQSWDRFRLPLPGSRALLAAAPLIWVPSDADTAMLEARRALLESTLQRLQKEVDQCLPAKVFHLPDRKLRDRVSSS